jgi:osmotically-inducible protein OsmY
VSDDLLIRDGVLEGIVRELGPEAAGVGVVVDRGVVRLVGILRTVPARRAAARAAHAVPGVRAVVDELELRDPRFAPHDDGAVARAAADALAASPGLPHERIELTVYRGYVTLGGSVADPQRAEAAEAAVRGVPGVLGVCRDCTVVDLATLARAGERAGGSPGG